MKKESESKKNEPDWKLHPKVVLVKFSSRSIGCEGKEVTMKIYFIEGEEDKADIYLDAYGCEFKISHVAKYEIIKEKTSLDFKKFFSVSLNDLVCYTDNILHIKMDIFNLIQMSVPIPVNE